MFKSLTSINALKYLIPAFLGFLSGFYLAETVTTRVYSSQQDKLVQKHKQEISSLNARISYMIEAQNSIADRLNATTTVIAEENRKAIESTTLETQKHIIKYKEKIVHIKEPCKLSEPSLDYIREHVTGK